MKNSFIILPSLLLMVFWQCTQKSQVPNYTGTFYYHDSLNHCPQEIPGRLECELYDKGGEGVAYHDSDSINSGSGKLNPANGTFLNEFRINESVDISYTKPKGVDNNPFNFVKPVIGQLYVGWTNEGEWINYTVEVKKTGNYQVGLMYTSNRGGEIGLSVDRGSDTLKIKVPTTYVAADTVAWRQWHHWNYLENLGTLKLKKGIHVLTLSTLKNGQMNYNYIDFKLIN